MLLHFLLQSSAACDKVTCMNTPNAEVQKGANESNQSLVRRFSKRVQGASVMPRARGNQFYERPLSRNVKKEKTLERLRRRARRERLKKLGKIPS